jgi:anti-anti-sigma factor
VGDLDIASADVLDAAVRDVRVRGFEHVVIDLRGLRFVDSSGLRVLLNLRNAAERDGHRLTLVAGRRAVQRIFELTATRDVFDWRDA